MYGKVFDSIYDGTLYGHWEAIVTMQQLIVLATPDGVVDMTPQAIAARTSIPFDIIEKGMKILADPDPYTRTPGDEGRRIVLLDDHRPWGWRLVNHGKYRGLRDVAQKREADRARIAEKRNKNRNVATPSQSVADVAHSDSHSDSDTKVKREDRASRLPPDFAISDRVRTWAASKGFSKHLDAHFEKFVSSVRARGAKYVDWDEALMNCIRDDWGDVRRKASGGKADALKPPAMPCGNCGQLLTGAWSQSPKGRVCDACHRGYMGKGWPAAEARA